MTTAMLTDDDRSKIAALLATMHLPQGLGTREEACSIAAINLALTGELTDSVPDCKIEGGIPVEGKGENSWDCGMDGLFGCRGRTVEEAIGSAVSHVLRDRRRYGGPHDLPRPMTVSEAGARQ